MSSPTSEINLASRQALLDSLGEMGGLSALFSATVAARAGINSTDLESLDLLRRHGPMTAGRLAGLTGLTTGAITGVIDRLERRGYARREADPADRRRVVVAADVEGAERDLWPLYAEFHEAMTAIVSRYSETEIALLIEATEQFNDAVRAAVTRLRQTEPPTRSVSLLDGHGEKEG